MNWSMVFDLLIIALNGTTMVLLFWSTKFQKRGQQAQADVNRAQNNVNHVLHARLANLERRVLSEEELGEAPNVH